VRGNTALTFKEKELVSIGASNSTADVSNRSVARIISVLETSQTPDEIKQNQQLQDSLKVLQTNDPVTLAASDRLMTIFNSLKSFVSLDTTFRL